MKTKKMLLLFFGVKGMIFLAPLSFFVGHYMITSPAQQGGTGVNALENGMTKLMIAAQRNDFSGAQKLVNAGADLDMQSTNLAPNYKNPDGSPKVDGRTALHMACANLDNSTAEKIIALLVNAGANVRIKDRSHGQTPLHSAAYNLSTMDNRLLPVIERLVKNGADINARNDDGFTLLHYAVDKTRRDWLEALLGGQFGALVDRGVKNNKGESAKDFAKIWHADLLDYFKKPVPRYTFAQRDPNGLTGLMIAVIRGNADEIKKVPMGSPVLNERTLEKGSDKYGYTALDLALLHQRAGMVPVLMAQGADPNVKDSRGNAPLHLIYKLGAPDDRKMVIKALVNDPTQKDAAQKAVAQQKQMSADLNIQNARGNTLLHLAVRHNDQSMVKFLLDTYKQKLNLSLKNNATDTPAQLARKLGYTKLQNMLQA